MTDPIADMLTRLRNSAAAGQASLTLPYSKLKSDIAQVLKKEGYIKETELVTVDGHQNIKIQTKFVNKTSAITGLKRVSRPGLRR
jgi:small subunit ribosomal protein S8